MTRSKSDFFTQGEPDPPSQEEKTAPKGTHKSPKSSGELAELRHKLEEKTKEAEENYARLLRLAADMENLKKRQERERADLLQFANENLVKELLPVVDNLERALEHGRQLEAPKALLEGIEMVHSGFLKVLDRFGVTAHDSLGQQFDPAFHNAMMQEEAPDVPNGSVIKELQKGYLMNQRLLRPAMVVVASNTQNETTSGQNDPTVQEEK
jgi:molecular chaperone GrpE